MNDLPFVSVVIPTFNRKYTLHQTIESLLTQTYPKDNYEILVVDDGSYDGTSQLVASIQNSSHFENLKYFYQENKGPACARNVGIKHAHGEIIVFIDSDCHASKMWVENIIKGYTNVTCAGIGGSIIAKPTNTYISQFCAFIEMNKRPEIDSTGIIYLNTSNCSFRKDAIESIQGFDTRYNTPGGEDLDLCYRLKQIGWTFGYNQNARTYSSHKHTLKEFIISHYNYGKGFAFLRLSQFSRWDLQCASIPNWTYHFILMVFIMLCKIIGNYTIILRVLKIPFKALLYYSQGETAQNSFMYATLNCVRMISMQQGMILGYVIGKFKGFKQTH